MKIWNYFYMLLLFLILPLGERVAAEEYKSENYQLMNIDKIESKLVWNQSTEDLQNKSFAGWEYDRASNVLYFAPIGSKELFFVDRKSLKILHKMSFGDPIQRIRLINGKLYIARGTQIDIVVPTTKKIVDTFFLNHGIIDFVVHNGRVIYLSNATAPGLSVYRIDDKSETEPIQMLQFDLYTYSSRVRIDMDPEKRFIYLTAGDQITRIDVNTFETQENSRWLPKYNIGGLIQFMGDSIFFNGREISADNFRSVHGTYGYFIQYVTDDYVFTRDRVYNRTTYLPIAKIATYLRVAPSYFMVDEDLYIYLPEDQVVVRTKLLSENAGELKIVNHPLDLEFSHPITAYYQDKDNQLLYLLFKKANELVVLNPNTLEIKSRTHVGSSPQKITMHSGKLYISFEGSSKLLELTTDLKTERYIEYNNSILDFQFKGEELIYFSDDYLPMITISNFNDRELSWSHIGERLPIFINKHTNQIYQIEHESRYTRLRTYEKKELGINQTSDFQNIDSSLTLTQRYLFENNTFYFGQHKLNVSGNKLENLGRIFQSSNNDYVITLNDNYIVSNFSIYNRATGVKLNNLPEEAQFFIFNEDKSGLLIQKDGRGFQKLSFPFIESTKIRKIPFLFGIENVKITPMLKDITHSFARREIEYLIRIGVIEGFADGSFRPKQMISNLEASIMLSRAIDLYGKDIQMPFLVRLPVLSPFYGLIYENINTSKPVFEQTYMSTTRKEMAQAIHDTFGLKGSNFHGYKDLNYGKYQDYVSAIASLSYHGITNGYADRTFKPDNLLTRDEFAAFLARTLSVEFSLK